jgi:hypothetical protein
VFGNFAGGQCEALVAEDVRVGERRWVAPRECAPRHADWKGADELQLRLQLSLLELLLLLALLMLLRLLRLRLLLLLLWSLMSLLMQW